MAFYLLIGLLALVVAAVPVAAALGLLSFIVDAVAMNGRLTPAFGEIYWEKSKEFILVAVPMFILLGEIMLRAGIAKRMYAAVAQWLSWLPGGLMHANIGACTFFAASSGSSVATAATIGTVAYPEIEKRQYNERLFLGSLAAGGTLGILIPPSINLIIFGLITSTSVPELYLAGIIPGVALSLLFMLTVALACMVRTGWGGRKIETTWADRWRSLPDLLPPLLLFGAVIGSIYTGWATPTEAASLGVCLALIIALFSRSLSLRMLLDAFEGTLRTTAMILLIVFVAGFLNFILGFLGVTRALLGFLDILGLTPVETILLLVLFYLILGMFMETFSMLLTTVPIVYPIIQHLGVPEYTGVWFGVLVTLLMEAALITPPIGINLYVVHGIRSRGGPFSDVAIGSIPFLIAMLAMILLLVAFPQVATWLPDLIYR